MSDASAPKRARQSPIPLRRPPDGDTPQPWHRPVRLASFVGRERERKAIAALVRQPEVRLLTLTGPGGIGKTRIALEIADELEPEFADGVAVLFLSASRDPDHLLPEIAQALGVPEPGRGPVAERLYPWLSRRRMLLVLDNFEQIVTAAPQLSALLAACPNVTALVTSRTTLDVYGEHAWPVPPLALGPEAGEQSADEAMPEAIELFMQRARAVNPRLDIDGDNARIVAEICRRLDGLPLAIELAAARLRVLTLPALLDRLDQRLDILTSTTRDVPERLRTMRNAIAWSHDLLPGDVRTLFSRLAVFPGSFTLDAAGAVADDACSTTLLDDIGALVASSLLFRGRGPDGSPRFTMLDTIREFGLGQLAERGALDAIRDRHAAFFAGYVEMAGAHLAGPGHRSWFECLQIEYPNIEAAVTHTLATRNADDGLRLCGSLWLFMFLRGSATKGREWIEAMLALPASATSPHRPRALLAHGMVLQSLGDYEPAEAAAREAIALGEAAGDHLLVAESWYLLGLILHVRSAWGDTERAFNEGLRRFRARGHRSGEASSLNELGRAAFAQGKLADAEAFFTESLELGRQIDYPRATALSLHNLGNVAAERGALDQALALHLESIEMCLAGGDRWYLVLPLVGIARVAAERDNGAVAARLIGAAEAMSNLPGSTLWSWVIPTDFDRMPDAVRELASDEAMTALLDAGRQLAPNEAIALARSFADESAGGRDHEAPGEANDLTPREREILGLLVQGLTDREIGEKLYISPRTAQSHVARLFRKLDVHSRAEAAVEAIRRGLA